MRGKMDMHLKRAGALLPAACVLVFAVGRLEAQPPVRDSFDIAMTSFQPAGPTSLDGISVRFQGDRVQPNTSLGLAFGLVVQNNAGFTIQLQNLRDNVVPEVLVDDTGGPVNLGPRLAQDVKPESSRPPTVTLLLPGQQAPVPVNIRDIPSVQQYLPPPPGPPAPLMPIPAGTYRVSVKILLLGYVTSGQPPSRVLGSKTVIVRLGPL